MHNMPTVSVAESNAEQAAEWDGVHGDYWAAHAAEFEECTAAHLETLIQASDVGPDSEVLDVGCGTGRLARTVAHTAVDGHVLGIDLSSRMIEIARQSAAAEGLHNVSFEHGDAQVYPFPPGSYDVVAGLTSAMFFGDKAAAFANLARALRIGGQLALITWQSPDRNPWFVAFMTALAAGRQLPAPPPDGPHPFSMADPDRTHALLAGAGFTGIDIEGIEVPMYFGRTPGDAQAFMLGQFGWLLADLDLASQTKAKDALLATMQEHWAERGVQYPSAAWLITARR